jgi:hypothetical protein
LDTKPIFPSANENVVDVFKAFKAIVEDFYSDEEERRDSYPEKGNHLFLKIKCMMSCTTMAVQL